MSSSIFSLDEFAPYADAWTARQTELLRRRAYYDGSIYRRQGGVWGLMGALGPALGMRLYRGTKALYLPLSRAVDIDAGIVPGGWSLAPDSQMHQMAVDTLFDWSSWQRDGVLFVHYGAMYGVSALRVCDVWQQQRVIIKPNDPCCVLLVPSGQYDATPAMAIYIEARRVSGRAVEYAEVITPGEIRTYLDGQPASISGRPTFYPNALGFVPFVEVRHIETGAALGEATFQKAMPLLDEVNELASYLADIIKKHAEPQWAIVGAEPSDMVKSGDNVWFVPQGGDAKPLVAAIDIPGVLAFVQEIRNQVFGSLPELSFDELKSKTQIATATLELQLMELVLKINRVRPNYDFGLAEAVRLAGRAGAVMGLSELAGLDDVGLRFDGARPVIPLDRASQVALEMQELALEMQRSLDPARRVPDLE